MRADVTRLLFAHALKPMTGNAPLVTRSRNMVASFSANRLPRAARRCTPMFACMPHAGIPAVIYGAGPRTVLESNAKRADEHLDLDDLRRATKVVARTLVDLLA